MFSGMVRGFGGARKVGTEGDAIGHGSGIGASADGNGLGLPISGHFTVNAKQGVHQWMI